MSEGRVGGVRVRERREATRSGVGEVPRPRLHLAAGVKCHFCHWEVIWSCATSLYACLACGLMLLTITAFLDPGSTLPLWFPPEPVISPLPCSVRRPFCLVLQRRGVRKLSRQSPAADEDYMEALLYCRKTREGGIWELACGSVQAWLQLVHNRYSGCPGVARSGVE